MRFRLAKEQGVPVINNASITDAVGGLDPAEGLVAANNPDPNVERGRTMANWLIADSDGTARRSCIERRTPASSSATMPWSSG